MSIARMLAIAGASFIALGLSSPASAAIVLNETFANDSGFTKTENDNTFAAFFSINSGTDYSGINDPVGSTDDYDGNTAPTGVPGFTGFSGNFFNGEDINAPGGSHDIPLSLTWSNLPISGLTGLTFSGLFAAQQGSFDQGEDADDDDDYDDDKVENTGDFIHVQYRINSDVGAFTELLWFSANSSGNLAEDNNFNGNGEGTSLALAAAAFSRSIPGTGTTLDLRISMSADSNNEAYAFDTITVTSVPEPSAFLFGGLVCGVIAGTVAVRRIYRRPSRK